MTLKEQKLKALDSFKDWSNYLLVTTVAAVGWVGATTAGHPAWPRFACIWLFVLSIVFGVFTLAVIPRVAEEIKDDPKSIYSIAPSFNLLWFWPPTVEVPLKGVCWPQHILFLAGVIVYAIGATF